MDTSVLTPTNLICSNLLYGYCKDSKQTWLLSFLLKWHSKPTLDKYQLTLMLLEELGKGLSKLQF